jgi:hypothetical protein
MEAIQGSMRLSDIVGKLLGSVIGRPAANHTRQVTKRAGKAPTPQSILDAILVEAQSDSRRPEDVAGLTTGAWLLASRPDVQVQVLLEALSRLSGNAGDWSVRGWLYAVVNQLSAQSLPFTSADLHAALTILTPEPPEWGLLSYLGGYRTLEPLLASVKSVSQSGSLEPSLRELLVTARNIIEGNRWGFVDSTKALREILGDPPRMPLLHGDPWAAAALLDLQDAVEPERQRWVNLLEHAAALSGAKPTSKWMAAAVQKLDTLGREQFRLRVERWLPQVSCSFCLDGERQLPMDDYGRDVLKGLIWYCALLNDPSLSKLLADTALKCFESVPGFGLIAPGAGNACILVLGEMTGMEPAAQLSRLKLRIKNRSALKLFDKALETAANKAGLSTAEYEEISVPEFGLDRSGMLRKEFGCSAAEIRVRGANGADVVWFGPDGTLRKAAPAEVKSDNAQGLAGLKELTKAIGIELSVQRRRVERLLLARESMPIVKWRERYLDHPLIGSMCKSLIWVIVSGGEAHIAIWQNGRMVDSAGTPCAAFEAPEATVSLWHPIGFPADQVLRWRIWLEQSGVTQPFKQAHREVYLITGAEVESCTYSNRFAAHVIKQHQFSNLCRQRNWKYTMQGCWDQSDFAARLDFAAWGLRCEFELGGSPDPEDQTESGIFTTITTDSVRFTSGSEVTDLAAVPPLIFSEAMRDVDLFVGVTSIGADIEWRDRTEAQQYREYWPRFANADLNESARTRKDVLERLLPSLKFGSQCQLEDKYLTVRGTIRNYRIHLGSGNILMSPNDQYLCIVPSSAANKEAIYLPFEGDRTLELIISKAILLAADSKITDPVILKQIHS